MFSFAPYRPFGNYINTSTIQGTAQGFPCFRCFSGLSWCPNRLTFFTRSCALRKTVRMGQHTWLLLATIGTELLAIIKWSKGQFQAPLPTHVWFAWLIVAAMLLLYPVGQVCSHATTFFVPGRLFRASNHVFLFRL